MDEILTYSISILGYNLALAFFLFAIVVFSRRKDRSVTPAQGMAVFLIAWLGGSVAVVLMHRLFAVAGTQVAGGELEMPIAILVVLPFVYAAHAWLSRPKGGA